MDLMLENMRNTILGRRRRRVQTLPKIADYDYTKVALIIASSFLLGRVSLLYAMFPCGIALITVLISKGRANIYTLPIILGGLLSNYGTGYDLWGDALATLICGVVFFLLHKMRMNFITRAFLAVSVMVFTKSVYLFLSPLVFVYDVFMMFLEAIFILALIYLFDIFFSLIDKEAKDKRTLAQSIIATSVVAILLIGGVGIQAVWRFNPIYLGALFFILFAGYKIGVLEGAAAGVAAGAISMVVSSGSPALIGIFACTGMVAGFFKGINRLATAICFCAVSLSFGLIKGYPELYLSIYDPLLAAAIFTILPKAVMDKTELIFAKVRQDHIYDDLLAKDRMNLIMGEYLETFEKLAVLYSDAKNRSNIISMQFRGMAKVARTMMEELTGTMENALPQKEKYQIKVGVSAYAKEDNISGDSYVCADLKNSDFMIALSDGMGKGRAASRESALTITSLYHLMKAGFDVELALRTINSLLLFKSTEEIFSTVDLGLFNKVNGKLKLFKIGAAATFIKRGDNVESIKVSALPMGIVDQIRISNIELQVKRGDEIIIVSDGITDADRSDGQMDWIKEAITDIRSKDPQTMADLLINKAVERYGIKEKDDMTVIAAVVE